VYVFVHDKEKLYHAQRMTKIATAETNLRKRRRVRPWILVLKKSSRNSLFFDESFILQNVLNRVNFPHPDDMEKLGKKFLWDALKINVPTMILSFTK